MKKLEGEADQIWAQRKSGQRLYYKAQDNYEDAERRKRESTVLTRTWKEVRARLDKISDEHEAKIASMLKKPHSKRNFRESAASYPTLVKSKD